MSVPEVEEGFTSAKFSSLGFQGWQVCLDLGEEEGSGDKTHLRVYVHTPLQALQSRRNVDFKVTLVNHVSSSKSVTKGDRCTLVSTAAEDVLVGRMASLGAAESGFLEQQNFCIQLHISAQGITWDIPPAQSLDGDVLLQLDDGNSLAAHFLHLKTVSSVFSGASSCSRQGQAAMPQSGSHPESPRAHETKKRKTMLELPLPDTSKKQALLLLHCLYAWDRKSWVETLDHPELTALGRLAHRFSCTAVLQLVDHGLVDFSNASIKAGNPYLTPETAPDDHKLALELRFPQYEAHVGHFLGKAAHLVDLTQVDVHFAAVLQGACSMRDELMAEIIMLQKRK